MTPRSLLAAASLCALLSPATALAVYVSGSGFGQALIYPYYTVRSTEGNAFNTFLSIVNGDSAAKALRVRFREARNGREVASFNLFLEAHGMWAGAIAPSGAGARLLSPDPACASPAFSGSGSTPFVEFSAAAFTGANTDAYGTGAERVAEGYIEVLEMGAFSGTLPSCAQLRAEQIPALLAPRGYIYGTLTLINVQSGLDFTANAEALANLATAAYYRPPSDPYPDFDSAEIGKVASFMRNDKMYRITMTTGLGAVEASMVRAWIDNEVILDSGTLSATDWIVTMPTRRFHRAGRSSPWFAAADSLGGELYLTGHYRHRSGSGFDLVRDCGFLCPGGWYPTDIQTPWVATVIGFRPAANASGAAGTTDALGSRNGWMVNLPAQAGGGALELAFGSLNFFTLPYVNLTAATTRIGDGAVASETIRLTGLPVTGFMVRTFRNGTLTCGAGSCQGNYGGSAAHRFQRVVGADP